MRENEIQKAYRRVDVLRTRRDMDDIERERRKTGGRPNAGMIYAEKALARYKKEVLK